MPRGGYTYYGEQFLGSKRDSNEKKLGGLANSHAMWLCLSSSYHPHVLSMHIIAFSKRLVIFGTQFQMHANVVLSLDM